MPLRLDTRRPRQFLTHPLFRHCWVFENPFDLSSAHLSTIATARGWTNPASATVVEDYLGEQLMQDDVWLSLAADLETNGVCPLDELTSRFFPTPPTGVTQNELEGAILRMADMLSVASAPGGGKMLPIRLHMMLRSLDRHYVCINAECDQVDPPATPIPLRHQSHARKIVNDTSSERLVWLWFPRLNS